MSNRPSVPEIVLCPGGPMLVRGEHVIIDEDGNEHHTSRPISAVCRCGHSAIKPWCDGTHKVVVPRTRRSGDNGAHRGLHVVVDNPD
jgi:CDGSH-type Zn-finger protein